MEPEVDAQTTDELLLRSPLFSGLDADARALLREELRPRVARRGEALIRQGDAADGLYLVASGRLQVVLVNEDGAELVIGELTRGDLAGEMALLTDNPRSATVVALRDSHLFFLSTDAFSRIVQAHPRALRVVSGALIDKLMGTIRRGPVTSPARSIVVVPLDASEDVRALPERLVAALGVHLDVFPVVRSADASTALGADSSLLSRAMWADQLEAAHGAVTYVTDAEPTPWTRECLERADLVLVAASARGDRSIRPVEHALASQGPTRPRTELVLLHDPSTPTPRGTREWLATRDVDRHHHIRVDRVGDYERVARLLAGRAVGVVFSGGGARGIAHVGAYRALQAIGLPIDATAGASIGAIVAGAVARGDSPDELAAQLRAAVVERSPVDFTFPTVSFASGGRVTQSIRDGAQELDCEDTWRSFLCVSTNLTRGALEVHTRGPGWAAVRSSFSIPGLFPPMCNEAGDLLVDGGVLDNMPVGPLRAQHSGITVLAFDVGTRREFIASGLPPTGVVSGWRFLAVNLRDRKFDNLTSLPRVLMRLTELGSLGDEDRGDYYIRPSLEGVSLLDFKRFDDLVAIGERDATVALEELRDASTISSQEPPPVNDVTVRSALL